MSAVVDFSVVTTSTKCCNKFTVSRTTAIASKKCSFIADRKDLNMAHQREVARVHAAKAQYAAQVADYHQTVGSRLRHHEFLAHILHEVQHYHLKHHGVMASYRAMQILAEHIAVEMSDVLEDKYANCLSYLAQHRVYAPDFPLRAQKMVAAKAGALSITSSAGLSTS